MKTRFTRKAAAIVIMSVFALAALATTTFAWFSVNKTAEATNIEFETIAPSNMVMTTTPTVENSWKNILKLGFKAKLSPSSTIDGENFYSPVDGTYLGSNGEGDIIGSGATASNGTVKFKEDGKGYYADMVVYIKAQKSNAVEDFNVYLSKFEVVTSDEHNLQDCIRIAVLPCARDKATTYEADTETGIVASHATIDSKAIFAYDEDTVVDPVKGINSVDSSAILNGEDVRANLADQDTLFKVSYDGETWTTLIIRVWIEGQHEDCLNILADETVNITLEFSVKELNQ